MPKSKKPAVKKNSPIGLILLLILGGLLLVCCCISLVSLFFFSQSTTVTTSQEPRNINFTDTFDSAKYGWTEGASTNSLAEVNRSIKGGKYSWTLTAKSDTSSTAIANPTIEKSRSMTASVDIDQKAGKEAVNFLLLNFYNDESNYYSFKVNQYYQQYTVGVIEEGVWTDLLPWTRSNVVNWETPNNLKVENINGQQVYYINNKEVFRSNDQTFTTGGIGIGVQIHGTGVTGQWDFDNFTYRKLQ